MTEEERELELEAQLAAALAAWPELADPRDEPCEVWYPEDDHGPWTWHPAVIRERVGPNEWWIELRTGSELAAVFRDLSEFRRPQR